VRSGDEPVVVGLLLADGAVGLDPGLAVPLSCALGMGLVWPGGLRWRVSVVDPLRRGRGHRTGGAGRYRRRRYALGTEGGAWAGMKSPRCNGNWMKKEGI